MFIAALFTIAKTWKQSKCPSPEEWKKKIWYMYIMEHCCCLVTKSCLTLRCVSDCSPPGSSVHGIYQARILECVAISSPKDLPNSRIKPMSPALAGRFFTAESQGSPVEYYSDVKKEWNNAICSNMNGPRDYHTMWSKSDREWQISLCDIAYMENLKKMIQMNLFTKEKWKTNFWLTKGKGGDKLGVWD